MGRYVLNNASTNAQQMNYYREWQTMVNTAKYGQAVEEYAKPNELLTVQGHA